MNPPFEVVGESSNPRKRKRTTSSPPENRQRRTTSLSLAPGSPTAERHSSSMRASASSRDYQKQVVFTISSDEDDPVITGENLSAHLMKEIADKKAKRQKKAERRAERLAQKKKEKKEAEARAATASGSRPIKQLGGVINIGSEGDNRPAPKRKVAERPALNKPPEVIDLLSDSDENSALLKASSQLPSARPVRLTNYGPKVASPVQDTVVRPSPAAVLDATSLQLDVPLGLGLPGGSLYLTNEREMDQLGQFLPSDRPLPDPVDAVTTVWDSGAASANRPLTPNSLNDDVGSMSLRERSASDYPDASRSPAPDSSATPEILFEQEQDERPLTDDSDIEIDMVIEHIAAIVSEEPELPPDLSSHGAEDAELKKPTRTEAQRDNSPAVIELSTFSPLPEDDTAAPSDVVSIVGEPPLLPDTQEFSDVSDDRIRISPPVPHVDAVVAVADNLADVHLGTPAPALTSALHPADEVTEDGLLARSTEPASPPSPTPDLANERWPELQVHESERWTCASCSAINHPDNETCPSCNRIQGTCSAEVTQSAAVVFPPNEHIENHSESNVIPVPTPTEPPSFGSDPLRGSVHREEILSRLTAYHRFLHRLECRSEASAYATRSRSLKRSRTLLTVSCKQRTWKTVRPRLQSLLAKAVDTLRPRKTRIRSYTSAGDQALGLVSAVSLENAPVIDTNSSLPPVENLTVQVTCEVKSSEPCEDVDVAQEASLSQMDSVADSKAPISPILSLADKLEAQTEVLEKAESALLAAMETADDISEPQELSLASFEQDLSLDLRAMELSMETLNGQVEAPQDPHGLVSDNAIEEAVHSGTTDSDNENEHSDSSGQGPLTSDSSLHDLKTPPEMSHSEDEGSAADEDDAQEWTCIVCQSRNSADAKACTECSLDRLKPPSKENPARCTNPACPMTFSDGQAFWTHICNGRCALDTMSTASDVHGSSSKALLAPARPRQALRKSTGGRKRSSDGTISVKAKKRLREPSHSEVRLWKDTGPTRLQNAILALPAKAQMDPNMRSIFEAEIEFATIGSERDAPKITVANFIDKEPCPPWEFQYTDQMVYSAALNAPDLHALEGCDCEGPCDPKSKTCSCIKRQQRYNMPWKGTFVHGPDGRLLLDLQPAIVIECNSNCRCTDECQNRVIQKGRTIAIEIRKTKDKGWGIFATAAIPCNTFVGVYAGELLTATQSQERAVYYDRVGRTYLFDLDFYHLQQRKNLAVTETGESGMPAESEHTDDEEETDALYAVDAWHYGNFTRFFNHSCAPNLTINAAYINEADIQKPLLAFYTSRDVLSGEELCFSYTGNTGDEALKDQDDHDVLAHQRTDTVYRACNCGATNCVKILFS